MNKAEKIMKKKAVIKAELDKALPKAQSDALWQAATVKLEDLLTRYGDLPKGVHMHTDSRILPSAAIYLTVKEAIGPEKAYRVIEDAAVRLCAEIEKKLQKLMRLPGMQSLFVKAWDPMTKKLFGAGNGFQNVFYPKKKGEYRMDITSCPYCRTFTELGCPELTKIFCENDERIYGRLPGLKFERTGTLGKGAERCDFCLRKA
ncbi:MAG: L-2-amino-thiazoline-4-carboxylic acid hydrolase [Oscillospiraceae bacterium]|nr:L-2-amino-thiazoline-4-carboxylic acid hydrolase [Oscillospiraceae bacterium]